MSVIKEESFKRLFAMLYSMNEKNKLPIFLALFKDASFFISDFSFIASNGFEKNKTNSSSQLCPSFEELYLKFLMCEVHTDSK